jgi:hypothetical protein
MVATFIIQYLFGGSYFESFTKGLGKVPFWYSLSLSIVISVSLLLLRRFFFDDHTTLLDRAGHKPKLPANRAHSQRRQSLRSGYASAHQEGFGKLITSGNILRKTDLNIGSEASSNNAANNSRKSLLGETNDDSMQPSTSGKIIRKKVSSVKPEVHPPPPKSVKIPEENIGTNERHLNESLLGETNDDSMQPSTSGEIIRKKVFSVKPEVHPPPPESIKIPEENRK